MPVSVGRDGIPKPWVAVHFFGICEIDESYHLQVIFAALALILLIGNVDNNRSFSDKAIMRSKWSVKVSIFLLCKALCKDISASIIIITIDLLRATNDNRLLLIIKQKEATMNIMLSV